MGKYTGNLHVLILETPWDPIPLGVFDDSLEGQKAMAEARKRAEELQKEFYEKVGPNRNPRARNGRYHCIYYRIDELNQIRRWP